MTLDKRVSNLLGHSVNIRILRLFIYLNGIINHFLSEILQNSDSLIFVFERLYGFSFDLLVSAHNLFDVILFVG